MCTVGNYHLVSIGLTDISMIFLNATHRGEFTMRSCDRLKCDCIHTRTVFKHLLHFMEDGH